MTYNGKYFKTRRGENVFHPSFVLTCQLSHTFLRLKGLHQATEQEEQKLKALQSEVSNARAQHDGNNITPLLLSLFLYRMDNDDLILTYID